MKRLMFIIFFFGLIWFSSVEAQTLASSNIQTVKSVEIYNTKFPSNSGYIKVTLSDNYAYFIKDTDVSYSAFLSIILTAKAKAFTVEIWYDVNDNMNINGQSCRGVASFRIVQ